MKKLLMTFSLFSLVIGQTLAVSCPFGIENDPYPGECARYVDQDSDGYCDLGQDGEPITESSEEFCDDHDEHTTDTEEEYSIEISGQEMKTLTIKEIANLWEIDENKLLEEISKKFDLQNNYTIDTILDEIKEEASFSPHDIKEIAENIKNQDITNSNKEKNTINENNSESTNEEDNKTFKLLTPKANSPYNIAIPLFLPTILYLIHYSITNSKLSKKNKFFSKQVFKLTWNIALGILLIPSVVFGLYLVFKYPFPILREIDFDFLWWHVEGSIAFSALVVMHILLRFNQILGQWRYLLKKK